MNGDLTDGPARAFSVEQRLGFPPDALAVPLELVSGDLVYRLTLPLGADSVVRVGTEFGRNGPRFDTVGHRTVMHDASHIRAFQVLAGRL